MMNKRLDLMKKITQVVGVSGNEKYVSRILKKEYEKYGDEIGYDNLGSIYCIKKSSKKDAKKLLVVAHMDEVGFIVKKIQDNGTILMSPIGGWWNQTILAQRAILVNDEGKSFKGTIGSIPPHSLTPELRAKPMDIDKMALDLGFGSKEEVLNAKIRVGDPIVLDGPFEVLNDGKRLLSKAWDDRYGCILGVELLEAFANEDLDIDLIVAGSTQEEVGLRGATTLTNKLNPDLAIVLDCSPANDSFGDRGAFGQLGKGLLVRFNDANMIPNKEFIKILEETCEKENVQYQYYQSAGGTDAGIIHKSFAGIPTLTICLCARNIHTNSSIIDYNDYDGAYKVLKNIVKNMDDRMIDRIFNSNK